MQHDKQIGASISTKIIPQFDVALVTVLQDLRRARGWVLRRLKGAGFDGTADRPGSSVGLLVLAAPAVSVDSAAGCGSAVESAAVSGAGALQAVATASANRAAEYFMRCFLRTTAASSLGLPAV